MSTLSRRIDASKGKVHRSTVTPNPEIAGILVPHGLLGKQNPDGAHDLSCRPPGIPDLAPNLIREKMEVSGRSAGMDRFAPCGTSRGRGNQFQRYTSKLFEAAKPANRHPPSTSSR
jgi:hypothetical protein